MTSHLHTVSLARLSRPTTSHNYCGLSEGTTQIRLQIPPERHTGAKHGIVGLISTHTSRGMWARCCALHRRGVCGWAVASWRVGVGQVSQIVLTHWKAKTRTRYSSGAARRLAKCPCCVRPCVDNHLGTYIAMSHLAYLGSFVPQPGCRCPETPPIVLVFPCTSCREYFLTTSLIEVQRAN